MVKLDKISHFLPIRFRNGDRVQQFAKKCPHCGKTVSAAQMHGIAANINERILLAAKAECSQCHYRFPVTCVITPQKRVLRVALPLWLYRFYIQLLTRDGVGKPAAVTAAEPVEPPANQQARISASMVSGRGESMGSYQGQSIHDWIACGSDYFDFERVCANATGEKLAADEYLLENHLVYKRRP